MSSRHRGADAEARRPEQINPPPWDVERIRAHTRALARILGPIARAEDWSLAVKAAQLAGSVESDDWLWGSAQAAQNKKRPWAYFQTVLADRSSAGRSGLLKAFAQMRIPRELHLPPRDTTAALAQRTLESIGE